MKNVAPHFGPASLDFHLNRPVISLIQLHIVPPGPPAGIVAPHWRPIWLVPEPPLVSDKIQKTVTITKYGLCQTGSNRLSQMTQIMP